MKQFATNNPRKGVGESWQIHRHILKLHFVLSKDGGGAIFSSAVPECASSRASEVHISEVILSNY
jgi:hypothetical protein